jgi:hypothetical protein
MRHETLLFGAQTKIRSEHKQNAGKPLLVARCVDTLAC